MAAVSTERRDFIYPTNHVVGTVGDAGKARAAIDALLQAGFRRDDIEILHGEEDVKRLDPTGADHGFLAQFQRTLIRTFGLEEFRHLTHHLEDIRAGRFVIMVLTNRRMHRLVAADILNRYGAEFVGFYGRWAWEGLSATAPASPQEVPALFARAWNDRNPDALAALFDKDAEFVNVAGQCWHGRDSIRKAHAQESGRIFDNSTLAIDETKVKLLAPDIAVVHARMTSSGQAPAGAVIQPGLRTTLVSFVVHRIVDRWLCASAHNTDVRPNVETGVVDEAGVFPSPNFSGGEAS